MNHTNVSMIIIMFVSGLLSSMYIWSDKISDMRVSLNDIYMSSLMTAWMFLLMGIYYKMYNYILPSLIVILVTLYMIRNQSFVTPSQYIKGMIPHHSMAITMSKRLLEKGYNLDHQKYNELKKLLLSIISTQEREIDILKKLEML